MKKLFLVDAYALIYKSYYAFLGRPMRNSEGLNTSAIFGFTKYIRDIIRLEEPHYLGVAFDTKGPTFRHDMFPEYKANRQAAPEDIHLSVPYIKQILAAMKIPVLEQSGYEADDIIGTVSCKASDEGFTVYMVTPDKDFGQLVRPDIFIYKQLKGGEGIEIIGPEQIKGKYGIDDPRLIIDILAIWGDASDNIPGVPGIGEKGAVKLVSQFGTVENILENTDQIKGKQRESIEANREQLLLSKELARICTDCDIPFDADALTLDYPDCEALRDIFFRMGFNMFIREIDTGRFVPHLEPCAPGNEKHSEAVLNEEAKAAVAVRPAAGGSADFQGSLFDEPSAGSGASAGVQADLFAESTYDTIENIAHDYRCVLSASELSLVMEQCRAAGEFCFDTETSGFDIFNDRLVGMSFAVEPGTAWYVPFDDGNKDEYTAIIKPVMEDLSLAKIGQNIKFDMMVLDAMLGIKVHGKKYDTMILHYLLDPESRHNMGHLARTYLSYSPVEIESLIGRGAKQITMDMVPVDKCTVYAAEDADVTLRLKKLLWAEIKEKGLAELYDNIEEPTISVLADLEMTGVRIDPEVLAGYSKTLTSQLADLERQIREAAGDQSLNVNSARQLGETLFGKMQIDPKPKRTKTKQFRTDEEYLQTFAGKHPIIDLILEYRGIKKLLSTYIDALPLMVNSHTGRLHTSFNQAVTSTGRLSSSNPNLQNIPIRDEMGREIRKAFVPSDDDHILLAVDYSQVELRLMAHLSGDEALLEAFRNREDIHTATAARLFGVPLAEVTADQRRKAKTANFGIIYGISAFGLSQRLNIPRGEAKEIIDGYFRSYPGVKKYMDDIIARARDEGYVTTIFGRKRFLRDIRSANSVTRGLAERNAINAPLQGSAADIVKIAMINVRRRLAEASLSTKIILQVHDELVLDVAIPELERVIAIVTEEMEGAASLSVDLTVDYGTGRNWLEAH